jgi:hypothetical protein
VARVGNDQMIVLVAALLLKSRIAFGSDGSCFYENLTYWATRLSDKESQLTTIQPSIRQYFVNILFDKLPYSFSQ